MLFQAWRSASSLGSNRVLMEEPHSVCVIKSKSPASSAAHVDVSPPVDATAIPADGVAFSQTTRAADQLLHCCNGRGLFIPVAGRIARCSCSASVHELPLPAPLSCAAGTWIYLPPYCAELYAPGAHIVFLVYLIQHVRRFQWASAQSAGRQHPVRQ